MSLVNIRTVHLAYFNYLQKSLICHIIQAKSVFFVYRGSRVSSFSLYFTIIMPLQIARVSRCVFEGESTDDKICVVRYPYLKIVTTMSTSRTRCARVYHM